MDRDQQNLTLLRRAATYGVLLHAFARDIYDGKDFAAVFKQLPWSGFLNNHHKKSGDSLPGGTSYITATPEGMAHVGFPRDRAQNNSHAALAQRLPVAWFCLADESHRRFLLSPDDATKRLGSSQPNNIAFVAAIEDGRPVIYRLYITSTDVPGTINQLLAISQDLEKIPLFTFGGLGIAVLAETPDKVAALREAVRPFDERFRIHVAFAPSPETVTDALKAMRRRKR